MKRVLAVIGANYGDEGKGLITDYLASKEPSLVVRFNGGAQAGHTVVMPDGRRHVFHHHGSGTFAGAGTFLSRFFIVNPIVFHEETLAIEALGFRPQVFVDPRCPVTTPWDMMLNQALEIKRDGKRHGSCGLGIFETIYGGPLLIYEDLISRSLSEKLRMIRETRKHRAAMLRVELPKEWDDPRVELRFVNQCALLLGSTRCRKWEDSKSITDKVERIIFEGAQGLALDRDNKEDFPHVTPSNTGIKNVAILAKELGFEKIEPYYVTRPYFTRHGAGPISYEIDRADLQFSDKTNLTNEFQGELRFAYAEPARMISRIQEDLKLALPYMPKPKIALTCTDQLPAEGVTFCDSGLRMRMTLTAYIQMIEHGLETSKSFISRGPTREDVGVFQ